jgi:hypothetical protein
MTEKIRLDKIRKYLPPSITDDDILRTAKALENIPADKLPDRLWVLDSLNRKFLAVQKLRELERTRNNKEIAGFVAQELAKHEKKSAKPRKAKNKIPDLPTKMADAYRWVLTWELIKPQIDHDPSLENNFHNLREWLLRNADEDISKLKDDTLRKIIKRGKAEKIPSRADFEREKNM